MRDRAVARLALAALLAAAVACTPKPSGLAPGEAAREFYPLVTGAKWRYSLDLGIAKTTVEVLAKGNTEIGGLAAPAFVMDETALGEGLGVDPVGPTAYVTADGYISRYTGLDYVGGKLRLLGEEDAARVMPVNAAPGAEWSQETRLLQQPENGGGALNRWTGRTLKAEKVKVPAGTFEDVLLVEIHFWDPSIREDGPLLKYEDYYARGIGLVRSVTTELHDGGETRQAVEWQLLDYEFPGPAVTARPLGSGPGGATHSYF